MPEHLDHTAPRDREHLITVLHAQLAHWERRGVDDQGRSWWWLEGRLVRVTHMSVAAYSGVTSDIQGGVVKGAYNARKMSPETIVHLLRCVHGFPVDAPKAVAS